MFSSDVVNVQYQERMRTCSLKELTMSRSAANFDGERTTIDVTRGKLCEGDVMKFQGQESGKSLDFDY